MASSATQTSSLGSKAKTLGSPTGSQPTVCREHEIAETLYYGWRDKLLEGGREALAGKDERNGEKELRRKIRELERALGRKTYELEIAGEALRGWD